ncbi:MAG TPA: adenylate/guanylate cyclase domain-containing protein [Gammaproteobacteria bacterium]|jgi:adenylate cyclase|nr:adenylate/guanylate cyclase domain-containing protein [Gammaproteobacteria bacterium]
MVKGMLRGRTWLLGLFVVLVVADFFVFAGFDSLEHPLQDLMVRAHSAGRASDPDVVVVDVDEASLVAAQQQLGAGWPWPRSLYAQLLQGLLKQDPKAVVFDIYFVDPDNVRPENDKYLIDVAAPSDKVFFPSVRLENADDSKGAPLKDLPPPFGIEPGPYADPEAHAAMLFPLPQLALTGRVGVVNFLQDSDKVGRRYYTFYDAYGWLLPSLPTRVAQAAGYPLPESDAFVINWRSGVPHVPFYELYADMQKQKSARPAGEFKDKIVVIGSTAAGLGDSHPSPLAANYPGVDTLATAISNLKNGDWQRRTPPWTGALLSLALLLGLALLFARGQGPFRTGLALVAASLLVCFLGYLLLGSRWLLPVAQPLLFGWLFFFAMALAEYLRERRERQHAIGLFGRFLDPRVVDDLVKHRRDLLSEGAKSREVTLLFSDIRGFTTLSESRTPEQVVAILNRYFSKQVEVVFRHGGTVDKFIGDAIMAFWGAPLEDKDQARHAVAAALEMSAVLLEFRKDLGDLAEVFDIGIGIHTGQAVVGFMGSENKLDYTAIGDSVNLASRIEGQTKGVARVLVSAATRERCGDAFDFTERGTYKVKGREQPVVLYEPREKA